MTDEVQLQHLRAKVFAAQSAAVTGMLSKFPVQDQRAAIFTAVIMATIKALWDDRDTGKSLGEFRDLVANMTDACVIGVTAEEGSSHVVAGHA